MCRCMASLTHGVIYHRSAMSESVSFDMCAQRWLKSACASAQSDKSLRCMHEETLYRLLSKMRPAKILIRLRECAGWSESSLGAYVLRYIFGRYGSNGFDGYDTTPCCGMVWFVTWADVRKKGLLAHLGAEKDMVRLYSRMPWYDGNEFVFPIRHQNTHVQNWVWHTR